MQGIGLRQNRFASIAGVTLLMGTCTVIHTCSFLLAMALQHPSSCFMVQAFDFAS